MVPGSGRSLPLTCGTEQYGLPGVNLEQAGSVPQRSDLAKRLLTNSFHIAMESEEHGRATRWAMSMERNATYARTPERGDGTLAGGCANPRSWVGTGTLLNIAYLGMPHAERTVAVL